MSWTLPARRDRCERGASAVEFALVMPILLMLLFGLISTGKTFSDHLSATNATREGSRYAAATNYTAATWAASVKERVRQVYFNAGETVTDDQICVKLVTAAGATPVQSIGANCGTAPSAPSNMAAGTCAVLVWMQRPATIELIAFPALTFHIGAESVAYYGREVAPTCLAP
jgi:Flp pilus assembly protein TadG